MKIKYFGFFRLESEEIVLTHKEKKGETTIEVAELNADKSKKTIFRYILREKKDRPVRVWWGDKPTDEKVWELTEAYGGATS